jgi:hypothetical protein
MIADGVTMSNLAEVGRKLLDHSQQAEFTAKRGAVVELFPYIFAAHERMSARAIGRFLEKEQGIKLSPVTITKALNDPKRSWNAFFDLLEPYALIFQKESTFPLTDFLFKDKNIKDGNHLVVRLSKKLAFSAEFDQADKILREKWFSIELDIRLKARPYLEGRLRLKERKSK